MHLLRLLQLSPRYDLTARHDWYHIAALPEYYIYCDLLNNANYRTGIRIYQYLHSVLALSFLLFSRITYLESVVAYAEHILSWSKCSFKFFTILVQYII